VDDVGLAPFLLLPAGLEPGANAERLAEDVPEAHFVSETIAVQRLRFHGTDTERRYVFGDGGGLRSIDMAFALVDPGAVSALCDLLTDALHGQFGGALAAISWEEGGIYSLRNTAREGREADVRAWCAESALMGHGDAGWRRGPWRARLRIKTNDATTRLLLVFDGS